MELSLPAGSLESAIAAFKGGADSVYLGMKDFSARKRAQNFSFDDLSKLKAIASAQGKKIYITINTVIFEDELEDLYRVLRQLEFLQVDGIIVQDLAAAALAKRFFPSLALHGSTQLAVHTSMGVKFLQKHGFSRVVLSRELDFKQIEKIRKECPDIELKVFIHGAMCYGFSGLCEASRMITGRSANRGECAQICRSWFSCRQTQRNGYFFSMKDLEIGPEILELQKIGIDSVKVEGRMKGPAYCYAVARYYRMILNGKSSQEDIDNARTAMETTFLRNRSDGYFTDRCDLLCPDYPQHMGVPAGKIAKVGKSQMAIKLRCPVALHDGLLLINPDPRRESAKFPLLDIEDQTGKRRSFANSGEAFFTSIPEGCTPAEGQEVYLISLHDNNPGLVKEETLPHYKRPVDTNARVLGDRIRLSAIICRTKHTKDYKLQIQEATSPSDFEAIFEKTFRSSADSMFTLGSLDFSSSESGKTSVFVPISALKEIRRRWYSELDSIAESYLGSDVPSLISPQSKEDIEKLPNRSLLGLWDQIAEADGISYLPLCPVMDNEEDYFESVEAKLQANPELRIGLNNPAHIEWAMAHPEAKVFADVYLYLANPISAQIIADLLPNLKGGYFFMEVSPKGLDFSSWPFIPSDASDFRPPLFISKAGFPEGDGDFTVSQNGKVYHVRRVGSLTVLQE
ncbi:MAG: DUF3656 domain-containing protein [Sphaerochaetaceae bacterium]|nr:DUF3656 domain-containing protein [Sphaerochaetaceae bacterium]MDD3164022.1 DUF3656 domain-containing protein [Sphaerochaetaceae bacterium]MDD4007584.1 DUF3656 domain-containing protein [Sphaerochaetaceae bacterium]